MSTSTAPKGHTQAKEGYFAANRNIWLIPFIFSITASWVQAPALIVSAEVAYQWGWQGLLWFAVPNALVLIVFAPFAKRVRERMPFGFTLSDYMRRTYGDRVHKVYLFQLTAVAVCVFAAQMIAGGALISYITGIDYLVICALMTLGTLAYSSLGGLRASVAADFFHIGATIITIVLFAPVLVNMIGLDTLLSGMSSAHVDSLELALTFGIPTAIGLMSGAFGDQSFWQRSFATRIGHLRKAFTIAGFLFFLVPMSTGMLGFVAAGAGMEIENTQLTNIIVVTDMLPSWAIIPFTIMVIGALASTMDNCLVSTSTLMGHDLTTKGNPLRRGRLAGLATAAVGLGMAAIPGLTLIHLWLIYATLRAATLGPTVLTFIRNSWRPDARGIYVGVPVALAVAMPLFLAGTFIDGASTLKTIGSVAVIVLSALFAVFLKDKPTTPQGAPHAA